jgi:hypothetical protein
MKKNSILRDNSDLRSEKVRAFLKEKPPRIVRWGIFVILVLFVALIVAVCLFHSKYHPLNT